MLDLELLRRRIVVMSIPHIDFKKDFVELTKDYFQSLERRLPNLSYLKQIKNESNPLNVCLAYFNLINRLVEPRPRKVLKSQYFYCPSRFRNVLKTIEGKIKKGEIITPFLSRGISYLYSRDTLLDAWGIHHIHLGRQVMANGFIERTGPILFVRFENDTAYFILIKRHGKKRSRYYHPWNKQILIDIIHKDWPDSIQQFQSKIELENRLTDDEIRDWSTGRINVLATTRNGTPYISPGGGFTLSGDNIQNVRICHHIAKYLENIEVFIKENINELIELVKKNGKEMEPPLKFKLIFWEFVRNSEICEILEKNSEVSIKFEEGKQPLINFIPT